MSGNFFDLQMFAYIGNTRSNTLVTGTATDDNIDNDGGNHVTINSGDGADSILNHSNTKDVTINGGSGNDSIHNFGSQVTMSGGKGDDFVYIAGSSNVFQYASGDGNDTVNIDTKYNDEFIIQITSGDLTGYSEVNYNYFYYIGDGSIFIPYGMRSFSEYSEIILLDSAGNKIDYWNFEVTPKRTDITYSPNSEGVYSISNEEDMINIYGGAKNDRIVNYGAYVNIEGKEGNDFIGNYANAGSYGYGSTLNGGDGDDTINNDGNSAYINGGDGNDTIDSCGDKSSINAGAGNDSILNSGSNSYINGEGGGDYIRNVNYNVNILGGTGKDTIYNGNHYSLNITNYIASIGANATIDGGDDDDAIFSCGNNALLNGGAGNDTLENWRGSKVTIIGGTGDDYIYNTNPSPSESATVPSYAINKSSLAANPHANVYQYNIGDGNDTIVNFGDSDTLIVNGEHTSVRSGNDIIVYASEGSILLQNATINDGDSTQVTDPPTNIIQRHDKFYTYSGNNGVIENYAQDEQINLASDFTGINLDDNNFYVNSSSGTLKIQNARDKVISYGDAQANLVAYSYMASGGDIDGRGISQVEIIIGGDHVDNQILAGSGGSSMWGGNGGADTLTGGEGYDEFFFAIGSGGDVIQNSSSNDIVNLLGVSLDQISDVYVSTEQVHINFTSGEFLQVKGNTGVGYRLQEKTYVCNQSTGQWSTK